MPKGKAFGRALRVTSLFFGSVKRNREKRSLTLLIPSYEYHGEEGEWDEEGGCLELQKPGWTLASQTREGQFASQHLQQDSLCH